MMIMLAPLMIVMIYLDVLTSLFLVMTTVLAPPILVILKLDYVLTGLFLVTMKTSALKTNVKSPLADAHLPPLIAMITMLAPLKNVSPMLAVSTMV